MLGIPEFPIVAIDWDGTIADTFAPSPNGWSVEQGYRHALGVLFDERDLFERIGGLRNRAPGQVIAAVLELDRALAARGEKYYREHREELASYVPRGKGMRRNAGTVALLTEALVRIRLQYLLPEISSRWPRPFDGVLEALADVRALGYRVAVISSGHTTFIEKCLRVWNTPAPNFLVTDDDMRALGLPPDRCSKPNRILIETMLRQAYLSTCANLCNAAYSVRVFVGDCPIKDRGLAANAGVPFAWFNPRAMPIPDGFGRNEFQFSSWRDLPRLLR
jgi:phosphoglycolate phosphatase-like HAD superfamily hydrolase